MVVLKVENLYAGYHNIDIIKNINFRVKEGEFIGIIGPNASGKTTLLRTIARIIKIYSGKIILYDKDIRKYEYKEYARKVAFSTSLTYYSLDYKVKDFILLSRYPWDFTSYDFNRLYIEFEIEQLLDKQLKELSSGELQRVIVAQTLAQTTKLILLDEPVSHLDIAHQISILDSLKKFSIEKSLTIIASFHELNLAAEYCDRLLLLHNGEIKKDGVPEEVLNYEVLEEVYNTKVIVKNNPISNKPYVIPIPTMWIEK